MKSLVSGLIEAALGFLSGLNGSGHSDTRTPESSPHSTSAPRTSPHSHPHTDAPRSRPARQTDPATSNRPETSIREASIADALAHASYEPVMDGDADPGEVVWTWVPYQEDASVGKDRPAVVVGAHGEGVYILQLTSKDHTRDAAQEAGLPGAGCAHECDDAALVEREAGGVDGDESVRVGHAQVLDVKQGHGSSLSCVRSGS